ncbi:MAG TPA: hypothetical protein VFW86_00015 [Candidatus Limnocylindrales bacterium]|jgi:hypothetical protein|nr:hypothetical protein [Candidatus Limnocylindrales bacterium]
MAHDSHAGHEGHQHGPNCGHSAVPHGDHNDYEHDGHRHAQHEGHWDEHAPTGQAGGPVGFAMSPGAADRSSGPSDTGGS